MEILRRQDMNIQRCEPLLVIWKLQKSIREPFIKGMKEPLQLPAAEMVLGALEI